MDLTSVGRPSMSYSEKFLRGLLPFIYCCDSCGHVYHSDAQVADNDPHLCDDCRPCRVEPAGCGECTDELACYAERPSLGHRLAE